MEYHEPRIHFMKCFIGDFYPRISLHTSTSNFQLKFSRFRSKFLLANEIVSTSARVPFACVNFKVCANNFERRMHERMTVWMKRSKRKSSSAFKSLYNWQSVPLLATSHLRIDFSDHTSSIKWRQEIKWRFLSFLNVLLWVIIKWHFFHRYIWDEKKWRHKFIKGFCDIIIG